MKKVDGNLIAEKIIKEVKKETDKMSRRPCLVMFLVGDDPSSKIYIRKKQEACKLTGIKSKKIFFEESVTHQELLAEIDKQNNDHDVDAILVQLPLPKHIDQEKILQSIAAQKDVDCLHPENFGQFCMYGSERTRIAPVTALAIERIINFVNYDLTGKKAAIVGFSNIVGKPAAIMLCEKGATVTICHDKTKDLEAETKNADLLVVAAGCKSLIGEKMIKKDAFVIDVGINRENGIIYGDVNYSEAEKVAAYITPVPGGVGPVTVALLMENTLKLARMNI